MEKQAFTVNSQHIPEAIKYHDDYASRFPNRRLFVLKESDVINPFPKLVKRKSKVA